MSSNVKPPSLDTQAHALYSDPHLYKYAKTISRTGFDRGPDHPSYGRDLACLAQDIEARIYGNREKVQAANADRRVWERKRQIVRSVTGRDLLPANPPTAQTVRKWRGRWVPRTHDPRTSPIPPALVACLDQGMDLGLKRARKFGQFPTGVERDFANPDSRHTLVADGTYKKPYSGSGTWTDPDGVEHVLRTRAKEDGAAVLQDVVHTVPKNGQRFTGVNYVVAVTRTKYGRVFLGVDRALGGESLTALEIFERITSGSATGCTRSAMTRASPAGPGTG